MRLGVAPPANDNHMMTRDANESSRNVSTVFAVNSVNNDENCDGDDDANGYYDCASHFALAAVVANTNHCWIALVPALHMGFQIEFSIAPYNNDRAMSLHTSLMPRDRCLE